MTLIDWLEWLPKNFLDNPNNLIFLSDKTLEGLRASMSQRTDAVLLNAEREYLGFYLRLSFIKESLRGLEKNLSIRDLQKAQDYLEIMESTGDINIQIRGDSFITFLVRLYYVYLDEDMSTAGYVYELIRDIIKIPWIRTNIQDREGNTPLMKTLLYQSEVRERVKNGRAPLVLLRLQELEMLLDQNGGNIVLNNEQQERSDKIDKGIYNPEWTEEILNHYKRVGEL